MTSESNRRRGYKRRPLADRFWEKVEKTDGCWLWHGSTAHGYGKLWFPTERNQGRLIAAHIISFLLAHGRFPEKGLTLDHLCRVRRCVNPDHLEEVTNRENILRGESRSAVNSRKTVCIRGHSLTDPSNVVLRSDGRGRRCRACARLCKEQARV